MGMRKFTFDQIKAAAMEMGAKYSQVHNWKNNFNIPASWQIKLADKFNSTPQAINASVQKEPT